MYIRINAEVVETKRDTKKNIIFISYIPETHVTGDGSWRLINVSWSIHRSGIVCVNNSPKTWHSWPVSTQMTTACS